MSVKQHGLSSLDTPKHKPLLFKLKEDMLFTMPTEREKIYKQIQEIEQQIKNHYVQIEKLKIILTHKKNQLFAIDYNNRTAEALEYAKLRGLE